MKLNPETISWTHDGLNTDGSQFDPELFDGWELFVDGESALAVPIGWDEGGEYTAPVFGSLELSDGVHSVALRLLSKNGNHSELSESVLFKIDGRTPSRPFDLVVGGGLELED